MFPNRLNFVPARNLRELGIGIVAYSPLGRGFFSSGPKLVDTLSEQDFRKVCYKHVCLLRSRVVFDKSFSLYKKS